jgi:hypothetical protein
MLDQEFVTDVRLMLGINKGKYIDALLERKLSLLAQDDYLDFLEFLYSLDPAYARPMDRLMRAVAKFANRDIELKLTKTRAQAKEIYTKLSYESNRMHDYARMNRNTYKEDIELFEVVDYKALERSNGESAYSKQELFVLEALGAKWHHNLPYVENINDSIDEVERVIVEAIKDKYGKKKEQIAGSVAKLLGASV